MVALGLTWAIAANYANNMGFLWTYFLATMAAISVIATWRKIQAIQITIRPQTRTADLGFAVRLKNLSGSVCPSLRLSADGDLRLIQLPPQAIWEGEFTGQPSHLELSCDFPFGIAKAVRRIAIPPAVQSSLPKAEGESEREEEFAGLRPYAPGDRLSQIHWKSLACGRGIQVKHFLTSQTAAPSRPNAQRGMPADSPKVSKTQIAAKEQRVLLIWLLWVAAPLLIQLPLQIGLFFLSLWGWRLLASFYPRLLPKRLLMTGLALLGAAWVLSYAGGFTLTASSSLFLTGLGLKLLELRRVRDVYLCVFLGLLVAAVQFLHDRSLVMAGYGLTCALGFAWLLLRLHYRNAVSPNRQLKFALPLVGAALPLAALMFLLVPRPPGGFFAFPLEKTARLGLDEVLAPGGISRLASSSELAFRVEFAGDLPPPKQRYWRALVFWQFDGKRWLPWPVGEERIASPLPGEGQAYRYTITVPPHGQRWLFALNLPAQASLGVHLTRELTLRAPFPLTEPWRYQALSYTQPFSLPLTPGERRQALALPSSPSPEVLALVNRWRHPDPAKVAARALEYFHTQGFRYTLTPAPFSTLEEFLFRTREGFCEHYASAFAYLMRVAGIPARVIGGYLGGYYHPHGEFLEVYQANAHAWVELWLDGLGWVRYDPTTAVAQEYVELSQNLPVPVISQDSSPAQLALGSARLQVNSGRLRWHLVWSELDYQWQRWVIGYSQTQRAQVLAWLKANLTILAVALLILGFAVWGWAVYRRISQAWVQGLYRLFVARYSRGGVPLKPGEGPWAYATRLAERFPDRASQIKSFVLAYLKVRYGKPDRLALAWFKRLAWKELSRFS